MDLMPYFVRSNANYAKTLKISSGDYYGSGNISEVRQYKHINGDIDIMQMLVEKNGGWYGCPDCFQNGKNQKYHYFKYVASEQKFYLKVDTLPVYPRHYGADRWFSRYMNLNDEIDNSDDTISDYNPSTGQLTELGGLSGGFAYNSQKTVLHEVGTANLGGNLGTVDYVVIDCYWHDNQDYPIERNTFIKDWGWARWQLINANASAWQSGHNYAVGDMVYSASASYGGITGITWVARTNHLSSSSNAPSSTTTITTDWSMLGPARWFTYATQTKQIPDFARLDPHSYDPVGPYLCATNGGGSTVIPNRAIPNVWEQFTITKISTGIYTIKTYNGKYLCAIPMARTDLEEGTVVADRDSAGDWEKFTFTRQSDGYYTIKQSDGNYVCAENGGEAAIVANRASASTWEKFGLHLLSGNVYNIWTYNKDAFGAEFSSMPSLSTLP